MNTLLSFLKKLLFNNVLLIFIFITIKSFGQVPGGGENQYKKIYYDNGVLASEGFLKDGKPNGYWKTYYPTGELKSEGNRDEFLLQGTWKFYRVDGSLEKEINYAEDKKQGYFRTYDDGGNLISQIPYVKDSIQGVASYYYQDGSIKEKSLFKGNLRNGETRLYHQDGRVIWLIQYEKNAVVNRQAINRYDSENRETGLWMTFHPNEQKKLVGNYLDGMRNGIFKEYDENGKLLNIYEYNMGKLSTDETSLDVISQDRYYYPNGQVKRIETKRGSRKQGFTQKFDKDGNLILSQIFRNDTLIAEGNQNDKGQKEGLWKYYYSNGNISSTGNYVNGKKHGLWKYYFEEGPLEQEGYWKMDVLDGEWHWYFMDGKDRCIMNFKNGKEDGSYIEYDQYTYVVSEGEYKEGYKVGKWYYSGGDVVEVGKYRDGLKDGDWESYYYEIEPENLILTASYRDGEPDGKQVRYYESDKLRSIFSYKAGLKNGTFIWYYPDGVEKHKVTYLLDELESVNDVPFKAIEKYFE